MCLGHIDVNNRQEIEEITSTVVRALDNVIDLNFYPVADAKITNQHYRAIGLGVSGYHHMLAKNGIKWESEEHLEFVDRVFEDINYAAIKASARQLKLPQVLPRKEAHILILKDRSGKMGSILQEDTTHRQDGRNSRKLLMKGCAMPGFSQLHQHLQHPF